MEHHESIDLDDTDNECDMELDVYEEDGFISFNDDTDIDLESLIQNLQSKDHCPLTIRSDELWFTLLDKQAAKWVSLGRPQREKEELLYKLGQFKTSMGKRELTQRLITQYGL